MFHKRTSQIAAIIMLLSFCSQPTTSYASELTAPPAMTASDPSPIVSDDKTSFLKDLSFDEFRFEAKSKIYESRRWVENQKTQTNYSGFVETIKHATDRIQDRVTPAGRSLKGFLKSKVPVRDLAHLGDRTVSFYGLLLILAFAFVVLLLSLANPNSRLGGRH